MIDPLTEKVVTLTAASKHCPERRRGKKPHSSCLYRWTTTGCKGVVLESVQIGGTRCTSLEALARFFGKLTAQCELAASAPLAAENSRGDVEAELDSRGL